MDYEFQTVDVFTSEKFQGNPAAVVFGAETLTDFEMSKAAEEFNLSMTAYVLPMRRSGIATRSVQNVEQWQAVHREAALLEPIERFHLRWFTPKREALMCGHATLAAVHALVERGRLSYPNIEFSTAGGLLHVTVEGDPKNGLGFYWLTLPTPRLIPLTIDAVELAVILGLPATGLESAPPPIYTQDGDVVVFVQDYQTLQSARSDSSRLMAWLERIEKNIRTDHESLKNQAVPVRQGQFLSGDPKSHAFSSAEITSSIGRRAPIATARGLCLSTIQTLSPSITVHSRVFMPGLGINEDPVSGSVHGPLAVHLAQCGVAPRQGDGWGLVCSQAIPGGRGGTVFALVELMGGIHQVKIGGHAVTISSGNLHLGAAG